MLWKWQNPQRTPEKNFTFSRRNVHSKPDRHTSFHIEPVWSVRNLFQRNCLRYSNTRPALATPPPPKKKNTKKQKQQQQKNIHFMYDNNRGNPDNPFLVLQLCWSIYFSFSGFVSTKASLTWAFYDIITSNLTGFNCTVDYGGKKSSSQKYGADVINPFSAEESVAAGAFSFLE